MARMGQGFGRRYNGSGSPWMNKKSNFIGYEERSSSEARRLWSLQVEEASVLIRRLLLYPGVLLSFDLSFLFITSWVLSDLSFDYNSGIDIYSSIRHSFHPPHLCSVATSQPPPERLPRCLFVCSHHLFISAFGLFCTNTQTLYI